MTSRRRPSRGSYYAAARSRARDAVSRGRVADLRPEQLAALRQRLETERRRLEAKYADPGAPVSADGDDDSADVVSADGD